VLCQSKCLSGVYGEPKGCPRGRNLDGLGDRSSCSTRAWIVPRLPKQSIRLRGEAYFVPLTWRLSERKSRYLERLLDNRDIPHRRDGPVLEVEARRFDEAQEILYMRMRLTRRLITLLEVPDDHALFDSLPELRRIVPTPRKRRGRSRKLEL
jgi:hypothetical protein